jgi:hypothetical protein
MFGLTQAHAVSARSLTQLYRSYAPGMLPFILVPFFKEAHDHLLRALPASPGCVASEFTLHALVAALPSAVQPSLFATGKFSNLARFLDFSQEGLGPLPSGFVKNFSRRVLCATMADSGGTNKLDDETLQKDPEAVFELLNKLGEGCVCRAARWRGGVIVSRWTRGRGRRQ